MAHNPEVEQEIEALIHKWSRWPFPAYRESTRSPVAEILHTDGHRTQLPPGKLDLATLQGAVAGYIEVILLHGTLARGTLMIVNEDGHRLGLPLNEAATQLARGKANMLGGILGDVVIATSPGEVD